MFLFRGKDNVETRIETNLPIQILEFDTEHSSSAITSGEAGLVSKQPPIVLRHSKFKEISKMKIGIASLISRLVGISRISGLNGISGLVSWIGITVLIFLFWNSFSFSKKRVSMSIIIVLETSDTICSKGKLSIQE